MQEFISICRKQEYLLKHFTKLIYYNSSTLLTDKAFPIAFYEKLKYCNSEWSIMCSQMRQKFKAEKLFWDKSKEINFLYFCIMYKTSPINWGFKLQLTKLRYCKCSKSAIFLKLSLYLLIGAWNNLNSSNISFLKISKN